MGISDPGFDSPQPSVSYTTLGDRTPYAPETTHATVAVQQAMLALQRQLNDPSFDAVFGTRGATAAQLSDVQEIQFLTAHDISNTLMPQGPVTVHQIPTSPDGAEPSNPVHFTAAPEGGYVLEIHGTVYPYQISAAIDDWVDHH